MLVHVSTDKNIKGPEAFVASIDGMVRTSLDRFAPHITRLDVRLTDQNSDKKEGVNALRCMLEARLASHQSIVVSHQADTLESALLGAVKEMKHALEHAVGKLASR